MINNRTKEKQTEQDGRKLVLFSEKGVGATILLRRCFFNAFPKWVHCESFTWPLYAVMSAEKFAVPLKVGFLAVPGVDFHVTPGLWLALAADPH